MMDSIFFDPEMDDDARRTRLFNGELCVYSPRPSVAALCAFARELAERAFAPHDPRDAQHHLPVEQYVAILARLKPQFINHPRSQELVRGILQDLDCDLSATFFDAPRLRTMAHGSYLRAGLAFQFHPHRDTWFSAPHSQLNWWLPIYDIQPENALAFFPRYWDRPVRNTSSDHDYDAWKREGRAQTTQQSLVETRTHPRATETIDPDPQIRLLCPVGGLIVFSAAHLHATVDNTSGHTRLSIDFRTVHRADLAARRGARNVDTEASGTNLRDFFRGSDGTRLPETLVTPYETAVIQSAKAAAA